MDNPPILVLVASVLDSERDDDDDEDNEDDDNEGEGRSHCKERTRSWFG